MRCWNLGLRALCLTAALALVAACSSRPETKSMSDTGSGTTTAAPAAAQAPQSPGPSAPIGPVAGSQEDLDLNIGSLVYFDFDKYDLKPDARATVERWAQWLQQNPSVTVTIEGHCDERGTREYNLGLGERRATSARNYLIALGVNGNRVGTISYGKERPVCTASNEACWGQNRRDHMVVN
jgi:peptidoglycan-associated lipoprotein